MRPITAPHQPGWVHETSTGVEYMVWAPRSENEDGRKVRTDWAASKTGPGELDSEFERGDTLSDAMISAKFPPAVRGMFRQVAYDPERD